MNYDNTYQVGIRYSKRLTFVRKHTENKSIYIEFVDKDGIRILWKAGYNSNTYKNLKDSLIYNFTIKKNEDDIIVIDSVSISKFQ